MNKSYFCVENIFEGSSLFFMDFQLAWNHYQSLIAKNIPSRIKDKEKVMFACLYEDIFGELS